MGSQGDGSAQLVCKSEADQAPGKWRSQRRFFELGVLGNLSMGNQGIHGKSMAMGNPSDFFFLEIRPINGYDMTHTHTHIYIHTYIYIYILIYIYTYLYIYTVYGGLVKWGVPPNHPELDQVFVSKPI